MKLTQEVEIVPENCSPVPGYEVLQTYAAIVQTLGQLSRALETRISTIVSEAAANNRLPAAAKVAAKNEEATNAPQGAD